MQEILTRRQKFFRLFWRKVCKLGIHTKVGLAGDNSGEYYCWACYSTPVFRVGETKKIIAITR